MNGFADRGLDDAAFGEKGGFTEGLRTFDAFPKTKPTYTRRTSIGGYTTLVLLLLSFLLSLTELRRWYRGHETHIFSVEKGISHTLQINLDIVLPMACADLHINVQDASGDRILAGDMLTRDPTNWLQWVNPRSGALHAFENTNAAQGGAWEAEAEKDTHVGHVLGEARGKKKFRKTPRMKGGRTVVACRVFGSLEGNKVQGDFHITARGHGYWEFGDHLDHNAFNFSHIINELSFGPLYPSLINPLDSTISTTPQHFFKYQYYLSIVPTIYTRTPSPSPSSSTQTTTISILSFLNPLSYFPFSYLLPAADSSRRASSANTLITNQYAATSHATPISERAVPGVFFKFDIEPILLTVREEREGWLRLLVRVVNVVSGVLVAGGWCYRIGAWGREVLGGRKRGGDVGVLHGGGKGGEEEEEEEED